MRSVVRAVVEGCLGAAVVAVAALLHIAVRSALRQQTEKSAGGFGGGEHSKRPVFLSRADEL
ncbi:MAG: hypothetical protein IRZ03_15525 [Acidobacterium ailaaui]|nr:hypothetical protein [Pseudacidobacterium ailaaui]MCL6464120.1 hypothetical protein [Pseudacidobacterium ailaaui]MDI3255179.1 hypothetical protein [Bacillota bacterium]